MCEYLYTVEELIKNVSIGHVSKSCLLPCFTLVSVKLFTFHISQKLLFQFII